MIFERNKKEPERIDRFVQRKIRRGEFCKTSLPEVAAKILADIVKEENKANPPQNIWEMFDIVKKVLPQIERPYHLKPYIDVLSDALKENKRVAFHAPPQHGKSTATLISLLYFCLTESDRKHCYVTYSQTRAEDVMQDFIFLLREIGVDFRVKNGTVYVTPWTKKMVNSVKFTSVDGSLTGYPINGIVIIDDAIKGHVEGNSPIQLEKTWKWFVQSVLTRESKNFSVICMMTRWNIKDLSGRLIDELKYQYIRLAAICDDEQNDPLNRQLGEALWPEVRPIEQLERQKTDSGEFIFSCMFQGLPQVEGSTPIKQIAKYFDPFDKSDPIIYSYGIDLAYSGKNRSDYCAIVCIETNINTGVSHITRCLRKQVLYREFIEDVKIFTKYQPGIIYFCAGGNEPYTAGEDFKKVFGGKMKITRATVNKYQRLAKSGAITAFNEGWLLMPKIQNKQLEICEEQLLSFTGADLGAGTDDFVDCISAAYDAVKHIRMGKNKPSVNGQYLKEKNRNKIYRTRQNIVPKRRQKI